MKDQDAATIATEIRMLGQANFEQDDFWCLHICRRLNEIFERRCQEQEGLAAEIGLKPATLAALRDPR